MLLGRGIGVKLGRGEDVDVGDGNGLEGGGILNVATGLTFVSVGVGVDDVGTRVAADGIAGDAELGEARGVGLVGTATTELSGAARRRSIIVPAPSPNMHRPAPAKPTPMSKRTTRVHAGQFGTQGGKPQ